MRARRVKHPNGSRTILSRGSRSTKRRGVPKASQFAIMKSCTNPSRAGQHSMVTRDVAAGMVRNAVFNTNELLVHILSFLTAADLLTASGVNKHWNSLIGTAPRLQLRLFKRTNSQHPIWMFDARANALRKTTKDKLDRIKRSGDPTLQIRVPAISNPIFFEESAFVAGQDLGHRARYNQCAYFTHAPDLKKFDNPAFDMFIALPPPLEVRFHIRYGIEGADGSRDRFNLSSVQGAAKNKRGITLRDVIRHFLHKAAARVYHIEGHRVPGWCDGIDFAIDNRRSYLFLDGPNYIFPTDKEFEKVQNGIN